MRRYDRCCQIGKRCHSSEVPPFKSKCKIKGCWSSQNGRFPGTKRDVPWHQTGAFVVSPLPKMFEVGPHQTGGFLLPTGALIMNWEFKYCLCVSAPLGMFGVSHCTSSAMQECIKKHVLKSFPKGQCAHFTEFAHKDGIHLQSRLACGGDTRSQYVQTWVFDKKNVILERAKNIMSARGDNINSDMCVWHMPYACGQQSTFC